MKAKVYRGDGTFYKTKIKVADNMLYIGEKWAEIPTADYASKYKKTLLYHFNDVGCKILEPILPPNINIEKQKDIEERGVFFKQEQAKLKKKFALTNLIDEHMDLIMGVFTFFIIGLMIWSFIRDGSPGMESLDGSLKLALESCKI